MNFNQKLKDFRNTNKMTQKEFADKYGFSRTTITELESGKKKPTLKMITKLANATSTTINYWLDEKEENLSFKKFDGLELIINKLVDSGDVDINGSMNDRAKTILLKMLEAEIKLLFKKEN